MGLAAIGPCYSLLPLFSLRVSRSDAGPVMHSAKSTGKRQPRPGLSSTITALRDDLAPPPLGILLFGQGLVLALKGVRVRLQLDAHGRSTQLECVTKRVLEVTLVRRLHAVQARAVDHHDGRIRSPLVRVAHLGAEAPGERRLLLLDRGL